MLAFNASCVTKC